MGYILKENSEVEIEINWEGIYGPLSSGSYRVVKDVFGESHIGGYDQIITSDVFIID